MGLRQTISDLLFRSGIFPFFVSSNTHSRSAAGEVIDNETIIENAVVLACVNVIQQGISQLPLCIGRMTEKGIEKNFKHPLLNVFKKPNAVQTASDFKESLVYSLLIYGNAFIAIQRTSSGIVSLVLEDAEDMRIELNGAGFPVYTNHQKVLKDGRKGVVYSNSEMIHIKDVCTLHPIPKSRGQLAADIIGAYKASNRQIGSIFQNGVDIKYLISSQNVTREKSPEEIEKLKRSLSEAFGKNGQGNTAMYLSNGKLEAVKGMTPADADMQKIRQDFIREIAAVYGVPAYLVGGSGDEKYNNVRQKQAALYRDTLLPIIKKIEEGFTDKLLVGNNVAYFDVENLLKGDTESQSIYAERTVRSGIFTINEAREHLGKPRVDDDSADKLNIQSQQERQMPETGGEDGNGGRVNEGNEGNEE